MGLVAVKPCDRAEYLTQWRLDPTGCVIVLAAGCFDLLHAGHVDLLTRAYNLGHHRALSIATIAEIPLPRVRLAVGLNSDETVRALKGSDRPIVPFNDRVKMLASLRCVDVVFGFDEPTPDALIRAVRPDLYVKGGDHRIEQLPELFTCCEVRAQIEIVPRALALSTTELIDRIRRPDSTAPSLLERALLQESLHGEVVGTAMGDGSHLALTYQDGHTVELDVTGYRIVSGEDDGTD